MRALRRLFAVAAVVTLAAGSALPVRPPHFEQFVAAADRYDLDWPLLAALARQESRFDPLAVGPSGAIGLMQVLPATAEGLGVPRAWLGDPATNIDLGARYLRRIMDVWLDEPGLAEDARLRLAIASYHLGPARLKRFRDLALAQGLDPDRWAGNVQHVVAERMPAYSAAYVGSVLETRAAFAPAAD